MMIGMIRRRKKIRKKKQRNLSNNNRKKRYLMNNPKNINLRKLKMMMMKMNLYLYAQIARTQGMMTMMILNCTLNQNGINLMSKEVKINSLLSMKKNMKD
jgi:hypothetical protein